MKEYQNGKIYKIVNNINQIVYIGSTCALLCERMRGHRSACKNSNSPFYETMRQIGKQHFRIILIKNFPCDSYEQLVAEEYHVMKEMKEQGIQLYNNIIDGCFSEEHKQKLSKNSSRYWKGRQRSEESKQKMSKSKTGKYDGENNPNFKFGSITKQDIKNSYHWVFTWYENSKRKRKFFSVNKYGHEHAIELCVEHRSKIYPNYQPKYVEIFFLDE
jgi:group I intron endonuclease